MQESINIIGHESTPDSSPSVQCQSISRTLITIPNHDHCHYILMFIIVIIVTILMIIIIIVLGDYSAIACHFDIIISFISVNQPFLGFPVLRHTHMLNIIAGSYPLLFTIILPIKPL